MPELGVPQQEWCGAAGGASSAGANEGPERFKDDGSPESRKYWCH